MLLPRLATLVGVTLALGQASAADICVTRQGEPAGLEADALREAVALEARKAGGDVRVTEGCAGDDALVVSIGDGAVVMVRDRGTPPMAVTLGDVAPLDRAREAARVLVALALAPPQGPLLDPDAPLAPADEAGPAVVLEAGAAWRSTLREGGDRGVVEALVGVALLGERLLVGVEGAWEWPAATGGSDVDASVTAGDVLATVRGGAAVGPVLLRGGVAGGAQWRTVDAASAERRTGESTTSSAGVLAAELEVTLPLPPVRLGLLASGRLYVGGESYTWLGRPVYEAPDGALGLALRLGAAF